MSNLGEPALISKEAVIRLNRAGQREENSNLKLIDECRQALGRMPEGKSGVVLGSGPNTDQWESRGWRTLDMDPGYRADFTVDANNMVSALGEKSQDFVCAEYIRFNIYGRNGVGRGRLLEQANKVLKMGGKLIVKTAHWENNPGVMAPNRVRHARQLIDHGFRLVVELDKYKNSGTLDMSQGVVYYAEKVAEGFDPKRSRN